jgi:hypothetical protein
MRWTSRGHIIFMPRNPDRSPKSIAPGPPTAIKVATRAAARGGGTSSAYEVPIYTITPGQQETASVNQWKPTCTKTH